MLIREETLMPFGTYWIKMVEISSQKCLEDVEVFSSLFQNARVNNSLVEVYAMYAQVFF